MKSLSAGLTFVNVATVSALLLGMVVGGLGRWVTFVSIFLASAAAVLAYFGTKDRRETASFSRVRILFLILAVSFGFFAFRSFCWLLFIDGNQLKVQSPNNLGDLALHIAYIRNFASGVSLWPENPIYVFSHLRYPAGTDLFNSLLLFLGVDLLHGLIWTGLLGSLAAFYALYLWGGEFGIAGFLFNGGLAGFAAVQTLKFRDYQGVNTIAWKSLPLAMFVTQRGLLYATPAGLLLLYQWRDRYLTNPDADPDATTEGRPSVGPLPFWVELTLYASMPLFHIHTFMALSIVAGWLFVIGDTASRRRLATIVGAAVLPATFFVWTITDHFRASSMLRWKPGWVENAGEFAAPFFPFWILNFGLFLPLILVLIGTMLWRIWKTKEPFSFRSQPALVLLTPAVAIFLFACLVKTAPWEWDNIKLILWAYLIALPLLWRELVVHWPLPIRVAVCIALFGSGFVSLFGGLTSDKAGFALAERAEVDAVGNAVRRLPPEARFAAYPTYNHPLLLQGRKVVLGYPGHLWTQGFDYGEIEKKLTALMQGAPDWKEQARTLRVRFLFWGREEKANYAASTKPWERDAQLIASGDWGAIYDLDATPQIPVRPRQ